MQQPQKSSSVSSMSPVIANVNNGHNHNGNMASSTSASVFLTRGQPNSLLLNSPNSGHNVPQQLLFGSSSSSAFAGGGNAGTGGLGHSSSSSILSQNSLGLNNNNNSDDKAYTQNALKQIRNSLQPFATKHPASNGLDRRPSSASSNASSSNSVPVAGGTTNHSFGQLLLQQGSSAATSNSSNSTSFLNQLNPPQPPASHGSYQYGQVNKLATSASSTQISLLNNSPMPNTHSFQSALQNHQNHHQHNNLHTNGGALRTNCDSNNNNNNNNSVVNAAQSASSASANVIARFDEHQKKLIKTLIELGLPEEKISTLSSSELSAFEENLRKQLQPLLSINNKNSQQQLDNQTNRATEGVSFSKPNHTLSTSTSSPQIYPNPPLQYHQLPSHPIVIDRMNLYQQAHVGGQTSTPVSKLLACQRSPGLGSSTSSNQQNSSRPQIYSRNDESSQNYFNLSDNATAANKNNNSDYQHRLQLLPNQPKILNSAGVPVTCVDSRYLPHLQQHPPNTPTYSTSSSSLSIPFHSKVTLTDSTSATSGYSSSSSLNGNQQQQLQQQLQQQNSTSSLASTNSSPSSSPYLRHLFNSNGVACLPVLPESSPSSKDSSQLPQSTAAYRKLLASKIISSNGPALQQSRSASTIPLGTAQTPPPPPLPPHRTAANAPTPPPIPPHNTSTSNSTTASTIQAINSSNCDPQRHQQLSLSTASLVNAVANSPQLQQYIREHMNATVEAFSVTSTSNTTLSSQVVLRSKSQPQIRESPQPPHLKLATQQAQLEQQQQQLPFKSNGHQTNSDLQIQTSNIKDNDGNCLSVTNNSFSPHRNNSPISFGRARLKAAAMAAAEQHQHHQQLQQQQQNLNGNPITSQQQAMTNRSQTRASVATNSSTTSSPSVSSAQMNEKLLAAQVAQKLQNLHLNRINTSYHNHHSPPPPSYTASSSSGRQSPTPTMSSSSDYASMPSVPPQLRNEQTHQPLSTNHRSVGSSYSLSANGIREGMIGRSSYQQPSNSSSLSTVHDNNNSTDQLLSSLVAVSSVLTTAFPSIPSIAHATENGEKGITGNLQAWSSRHAVSQSPVIMQSVKSQKVQKPVLQTAVAPTLPPINAPPPPPPPPPPLSSSSTNSTLKGSLNLSSVSQAEIVAALQQQQQMQHLTFHSSEHSTNALQMAAEINGSVVLATEIQNKSYPYVTPPPSYGSASSVSTSNVTINSNYINTNPISKTTTSGMSSPPPPPPPPYSMSLSLAQQDSIAQIFSQNFCVNSTTAALVVAPPGSAFGGSNCGSSVTSSSTANKSALNIPTTDPPSYETSIAVLKAQRAAVVGTFSSCSSTAMTMTTTTVTTGCSTNSTITNSISSTANSTATTSNCDLVTTMESILSCNSQVNVLQLGQTANPTILADMATLGTTSVASRVRALESTLAEKSTASESVPPLPPKPSVNGQHSGPVPPPLPPQPPHLLQQHQQQQHQNSNKSNENSECNKQEIKNDQVEGRDRSTKCETITCEDGSLLEIEKEEDGSVKRQTHLSPIPTRRGFSSIREKEPRDFNVIQNASKAFKFYMEQHIENLGKLQKQRQLRREQLESEMAKIGLTDKDANEMRRMLYQKESNYIRLRRAKMDRSMFKKIKTIGVGAFGEVALVKKVDVNTLYAMKKLRKADVLTRKQVAHVKAERDILAEADNEWVVKLYYSFQDEKYLYFVMDYIPGGDLMSLLIKLNLFDEPLARFYIAELVLAVESVHKMGFIHRDIKPDNVLIDKDGHIKLTDFGLCTGFRWTHDSKYYHDRASSMDFGAVAAANWGINSGNCNCSNGTTTCPGNSGNGTNEPPLSSKPLERRKHRREHQRCLAHSLVGTPNYIAPEVLRGIGYTQGCDWWSVGVILYEMVVGSPPFFANTPEETQLKVINWRTTLRIPYQARLSFNTSDLITRLCCDAENRIGRNGADEIKAHPFFASINFESGLRNQKAPYVPEIRHPMDTSNFDPVPERLHDSDSDSDVDSELDEYGMPLPDQLTSARPPSSAASDKDGTPSSTSSRTSKQNRHLKSALGQDPKHPQHAFLEFTFRRFFDNTGNAYPIRFGGGSPATFANSDAEELSSSAIVNGSANGLLNGAVTTGNGFSRSLSPTISESSSTAQNLYGSIGESQSVGNTTSSNVTTTNHDNLTLTSTTNITTISNSTTIVASNSPHHDETLYIYDEVCPEITSSPPPELPHFSTTKNINTTTLSPPAVVKISNCSSNANTSGEQQSHSTTNLSAKTMSSQSISPSFNSTMCDTTTTILSVESTGEQPTAATEPDNDPVFV